jgi:peptide/nickel transport system permease protein
MARIVRSQGLAVREQDFVAAAEAGGLSRLRVAARHILPNTVAPVIVQATLSMGYAVLTEAALGFIGVGVQPPTATWGNMLQQAFPLLQQQPLLSIVPGVAIFLLVLAFNFVGDALRDVLDPRLKGVIH